MAQVDRLRSLERGVLGSSSLCGGSFVAVFTFSSFHELPAEESPNASGKTAKFPSCCSWNLHQNPAVSGCGIPCFFEQSWSPFLSSQIITALLAAAQCYSVPDLPYCYTCKMSWCRWFSQTIPLSLMVMWSIFRLLIMLWCTLSQISRRYLKIWDLASSLEGTGRSLTIRKNNWETLFVLLRNGTILGSTKCGRNGKISLSALDQVAPVITTKVSSTKRRCPWMTPELLNIFHKQKSVYRKVVRSGGKDLDSVRLHQVLRSQSSTLYRRLKNIHFRVLLNGYRQSPKNLWHTINFITGRQCQRSASTISLSRLVNHFSTLFHYPGPPCELLCGPDNVISLFNFQPVTKHDVERTLLSFASSKSPGPDGICSSELKLAAKTISGMLTIVFNESLATGEVPQDFKLGNIIPLLKPGKKDTTSPANYRGITLNSILSN